MVQQTWIKRNNKRILIQGVAPYDTSKFLKALMLSLTGHAVGFDMETGDAIDVCCDYP